MPIKKLDQIKKAVKEAVMNDQHKFPNISVIASIADVEWTTAKSNLLILQNQGYCSLDKAGNSYIVSASAKLIKELGVTSDD